MPKPTKILIVTDSAVLPSGMAETTRLIFGNLLRKYPGQYEIEQLGWFHCYAVTNPLWPIHSTQMVKNPQGKLICTPGDEYGQKSFFKVLPKFRPDIVFAFGDPQNVFYLCSPPYQRRYKLILYVNFDGQPMPSGYGKPLSYADRILTKSEFSMNVIARCLPSLSKSKLGYMYSPADVERFKPVSEETKVVMRRDLLPPWMPQNAFLLGWIGRNQWRKQLWVLFKVIHYLRTGGYLVCKDCGGINPYDWDPTRQCHLAATTETLESPPGYRYDHCHHCKSLKVEPARPLDDVFLWLHTPEEQRPAWPLPWLEAQWGLRRDRDIYYTPEHGLKFALAPADVPMLYQFWDCLLFLSGGEGFGLPAWEAMCSALPLVYTRYSAHGEFVDRANAGLPVSGILQPEPDSCIWRMVADVPQAIQAVRRLYNDRSLGRTLAANGRAFVQQFTPEVQIERWHRIFQELMTSAVHPDTA